MDRDVNSLSDEQLCSLASHGDDAAMAELIKRIAPLAGAKAAMYNHANLHRDDLLQEGMLGFITAVNTYDPSQNASFRTYAGVCINNRIVSVLRRELAQKNIPPEMVSAISEDAGAMQDYSADPQDIFSEYEDAERLRSLLDERLSEFERSVLMLRVGGLGYEQIAKRLGVSAKAVDNALLRARKKLLKDKP